jgi:hypothetical protein
MARARTPLCLLCPLCLRQPTHNSTRRRASCERDCRTRARGCSARHLARSCWRSPALARFGASASGAARPAQGCQARSYSLCCSGGMYGSGKDRPVIAVWSGGAGMRSRCASSSGWLGAAAERSTMQRGSPTPLRSIAGSVATALCPTLTAAPAAASRCKRARCSPIGDGASRQ